MNLYTVISDKVSVCFFMRPIYTAKPIGDVVSLAAALGMAVPVLIDFSSKASSLYTNFDIPKKDGKSRQICSPSHELKIIQKRINRSIFGNVSYPDYLFGGIPSRDYVMNARYHAEAKGLIALDIRNFYPSISARRVNEIFKYFCKFPEPVADILTRLTTLNGAVPQGACTSSHIANLVFHDTEHRVVREFVQQRFRYSRLLDDICISSQKPIPENNVTALIKKVTSLLREKGFKLRDSKTRVTSKSNPKELMEVTGLWLNRGKPRAQSGERKEIRSEVHRCELRHAVSNTASDYHVEHNRLCGRVSKLVYLNHFEAASYRGRLSKILPHYGVDEINKTRRLVQILARTPSHDRGKYSFIEKYHQVMYRIGIVARTHRKLAGEFRLRLNHCRPTQSREDHIYANKS